MRTCLPRNWERVTRSPEVEGRVKSGATVPAIGACGDCVTVVMDPPREFVAVRFEEQHSAVSGSAAPGTGCRWRREHDTCYLCFRLLCTLAEELPPEMHRA